MDINNIPSLAELEKMTPEQIEEITKPESEVVPIYEAIDLKRYQGDKFSTGFSIFDTAMKGGLRGGDLVVVTGISGQGKTTLAQTLTYNLCANGLSTLWFSYEVSLEHLHEKFQAMGMEKHYHAFAPRRNQSGSVDWIKGRILEGWKKYLTKIVFIDHIDFLTPSSTRTSDNETIALKKIATELKQLAVHLDVVIVLLAHVKKLPSGKEAEMQDISSSAGIYQLADYVFIIQRLEESQKSGILPNSNEGFIFTNESKIKLVKNRLTGQTVYIIAEHTNQKFMQKNGRSH